MVILGEAGMGKSTLLNQLCDNERYAICTARKLVNSADPALLFTEFDTLVIDALDEVPSLGDGDAVDRVIQKLGTLGYPRFILSCRVADWRSATALLGLSDFYPEPPVELHLEPFDREDAFRFLTATLGSTLAEDVIAHLEQNELSGLWENPQTLELVERVAREQLLPKSKGELFERAVKLMAREHRDEKANSELAKMPFDAILDAAGSAFASLILAGKEAVSKKLNAEGDDIILSDIFAISRNESVAKVLGSRLFKSLGTDRFTYSHRAVGEFLGARWLARECVTSRQQRRLLQLFNGENLVPASLRGLHAWLGWHGPSLSEKIIERDPMGVVQYGDATRLNSAEASKMLASLKKLAITNPRFKGWTKYQARGVAQASTREEIGELIVDEDTPFDLKIFLLEALGDNELSRRLIPNLEQVMTNRSETFAARKLSGDLLIENCAEIDWDTTLEAFISDSDENSRRLAYELMQRTSFEPFNDELILKAVLSQLDRATRSIGVFHRFPNSIASKRIDALLDGLSAEAKKLKSDSANVDRNKFRGLNDLIYALLATRLESAAVETKRLWSWLENLKSRIGVNHESERAVADSLSSLDQTRRAIQKLVFLDQSIERNFWQRRWSLIESSSGLAPNDEDVVILLDHLKSGDARWKDVVSLVRHDMDAGKKVRLVACPT